MLVDGKKTVLRCADCDKPLARIWANRPDELDKDTGKPIHWKIAAKCCYCKGKSYVQDFYGGIHQSGYGKAKPDDETSEVEYTNVYDIVEDTSHTLLLLIEKVAH